MRKKNHFCHFYCDRDYFLNFLKRNTKDRWFWCEWWSDFFFIFVNTKACAHHHDHYVVSDLVTCSPLNNDNMYVCENAWMCRTRAQWWLKYLVPTEGVPNQPNNNKIIFVHIFYLVPFDFFVTINVYSKQQRQCAVDGFLFQKNKNIARRLETEKQNGMKRKKIQLSFHQAHQTSIYAQYFFSKSKK